MPLSELRDLHKSLTLKVNTSEVSGEFIDRVENIIKNYPGKCLFEIVVEDKKEDISVKMVSKSKKVGISSELLIDLNKLSGVECELK